MTWFFLAVVTALALHYVWFILRVRNGLSRLSVVTGNGEIPFVTVIVAARDEEATIERCITSVMGQDYPGDRFELIVVDDGSTDRTTEKVQAFFPRHRTIRMFSLSGGQRANVGRKPEAIAAGIREAKGEIIVTTDADCVVAPTWLTSTVAHFQDDTAFISGPVVEQSSGSFLSNLERLEFLGLVTTGAGLIGAGRPIICNGANIAFRKSAFAAAGGFGNGLSSCDDETLMQRIYRRKVGAVTFAPDTRALVTTAPNNDLSGFWRQRVRWTSKKSRYEDTSILITLVLLYFFFLSILVTAAASIVIPTLRLPLIALFAGKLCVDFLLLSRGAKMLKQDVPLSHFLVAELFHVPYIVVTAAIGQFISFEWKGRTLDQ